MACVRAGCPSTGQRRQAVGGPRQSGSASALAQGEHGLDWRGKRDRHVAGDLIIVFALCLECADRGFQAAGVNDCRDGPAPYRSNAIIFLSLGSHRNLFARA